MTKPPTTRIIGSSPISFVSEETGEQYHIPLSALAFDASKAAVDSSGWSPGKGKKLSSKDEKLLQALLARLLRQGVLSKP